MNIPSLGGCPPEYRRLHFLLSAAFSFRPVRRPSATCPQWLRKRPLDLRVSALPNPLGTPTHNRSQTVRLGNTHRTALITPCQAADHNSRCPLTF